MTPEVDEVPTYFCACSWIGGDPDERRGKPPTCPACWKIDRRRVPVKLAPPCRLTMRCLCCMHSRGAPADVACNADESAWPCRFCWAYFPKGGFEVNAAGVCAACAGSGVHPDDDGDPSQDDDDDDGEDHSECDPDANRERGTASWGRCPTCGKNDQLCVTETYTAMHPYNPRIRTASNALGRRSPSNHFDDGNDDYGMCCRSCGHKGTLAEFGAELRDWE